MLRCIIILLLPLALLSQTEEKRLALVIGNSNYDKGPLNNPVNDALLMAQTLDSLDFDIILDTNISNKVNFERTIREFGNKRKDYDVAFVYYAGHGIQVGSENFLIPTKVNFETEYDVIDFGVSVQKIMRYLTGMTNQVNILVLDACRDNPFEGNWNKSRSLKGNGLAKIPPPTGSLIAFSTDAGNTAADGEGENSIYCKSLSKNLLKPNTEINQIFKNVRTDVLLATEGYQSPVENSKLTGDEFYLIFKEDKKIISLEKELENSFKKLNDYEDHINTNDMKIVVKNDPKNNGSLDLLEFFNSTAKFAKDRDDKIYILSLFGMMKIGIAASQELTDEADLENLNDYAIRVAANSSYILYREITKISDEKLNKLLINSITKEESEEFRTRVKFGYLLYALLTNGESAMFNSSEAKDIINELYCAKEDLKPGNFLLFMHYLQQAISIGFLNYNDIKCFKESTNKEFDFYKNISNISDSLSDDIKASLEKILIFSKVFEDYGNFLSSEKKLTSSYFNTSFALYYVSFDRAKIQFLRNYANVLASIEFETISSYQRIIDFLSNEIDKVNNIGTNISQTYFEEFNYSVFNDKDFEYSLYEECFAKIASLNNIFFLSVNTLNIYDYQYQFLLFSNYIARHHQVMRKGFEKLSNEGNYSEKEIEEFLSLHSESEMVAMLNLYTAANTVDDLTKPKVEYIKKESKMFLENYFKDLIQNEEINNVQTIINYVYFKSRYCLNEKTDNSELKFNCFSEIASIINSLNYEREYHNEFFDDEDITLFYQWYIDCEIICDSLLSKNDSILCFKKNANYESKKQLDYIHFYEEYHNGLGNYDCFIALGNLLDQQILYLSDEINFIYKLNEYLMNYTKSFIELTILRSNLGGSTYLGDTKDAIVIYFNKINKVIEHTNISNIEKKFIVGGALFKISQFLEDFSFSEEHVIVGDLIGKSVNDCFEMVSKSSKK